MKNDYNESIAELKKLLEDAKKNQKILGKKTHSNNKWREYFLGIKAAIYRLEMKNEQS